MKSITNALAVLGFALLMFGIGFYGGMHYQSGKAPEIDISAIQAQLSDCSDLTTSKLSYAGFVHFEEGDIPLITKKEFSMTYSAEARAGMELSQAKVTVLDDVISVALPEAELQVIAIDPDSLEFFDSKRALFNWQDRTDAATALAAAEEDMRASIDQAKLIAQAEEQAREVVSELLAPLEAEGYTIQIS